MKTVITSAETLQHLMEELDIHEQYARFISKQNCGLHAPYGWLGIIQKMFAVIEHSGCEDIRVQQIKEKFGGLRFYYEGGNEFVFETLHKIEKEAFHACQVCGDPVDKTTSTKSGWIATLCEKHKDPEYDSMTEKDVATWERREKAVAKKFAKEEE